MFAESSSNLALNKPAYQISTLNSYSASIANDGSYDQNSFSHTNDGGTSTFDQWWIVDLEQWYSISKIVITGRFGQGKCNR